MAIFKTKEDREIAVLQTLEKQLARRERHEKILRCLVALFAILSIGSFVAGRYSK